jgi:O-antigen ligase
VAGAGNRETGSWQRLRRNAGRANILLPALLAFVLPLSTSAVTGVAILILLLWLVEGRFIEKTGEIIANPVVMAVLAYLAVMALGLLWTPDLSNGLDVLQGRWKIAMLPVFLTAVSWQYRSRYVFWFLAGLSIAMAVTYLAWFDLVHYADVSPVHLTRKTFHVVYNPLLAFGIYLLLHQLVWGQLKPAVRIGLAALAALMVFNMFITEGRTGQIVFFILMGLLLFQLFRGSRWKAVAAVCLLLPMMFAAGYLLSPVFKQRIDVAITEMCNFRKNPNTSVGMRVQFSQNSLDIIRRHPWFGVGTGGFKGAYAQVNQSKTPWCVATDNPHDQYILILSMLGIPGLAALLLIFVSMFCQAWLVRDGWQRIRFAFPLFFMVMMLAESYLKVYETGFFFALFAAVLYKKKPDERLEQLCLTDKGGEAKRVRKKKCWLILSYRANVAGSACSQHIDDRLPFFREQGIEPILLTGPVGEQAPDWIHYRTHSLAPSGIRFELRHFLRKQLPKRWQFKVVETILMLPVFPLYLLEKIIINLESEWSWWCLASLRGYFICRTLQPEVLYSTGGSASAHVAALFIKQWTGVKWLAETQDPLVHDQDWQRSKMVLRLYRALEKKICQRADAFVFLVRTAMEHCSQRVAGSCRGVVVYPGSVPALFKQGYTKGSHCHFAHFGSLAGSRNLVVFFQALRRVLDTRPEFGDLVQVDIYGSFDGRSVREMETQKLQKLTVHHGAVPRKEAMAAMQQADCLLLIQNIIYFSCETIPSKVYEYLLAGRPILGLLYNNEELTVMLTGHRVAAADDVAAVAGALEDILRVFTGQDPVASLPVKEREQPRTVAAAVQELIQLADRGVCS